MGCAAWAPAWAGTSLDAILVASFDLCECEVCLSKFLLGLSGVLYMQVGTPTHPPPSPPYERRTKKTLPGRFYGLRKQVTEGAYTPHVDQPGTSRGASGRNNFIVPEQSSYQHLPSRACILRRCAMVAKSSDSAASPSTRDLRVSSFSPRYRLVSLNDKPYRASTACLPEERACGVLRR